MELVARIPLFDRLTSGPMGSVDGRNLNAEGLQRSLCRDLGRLLSSRNGLSAAEFLSVKGGVMHYGLPDMLGNSPDSGYDIALIVDVMRHAITLYEPRLINVSIGARLSEINRYGLDVHLKATAISDGQSSRVDFDLLIGSNGIAMQSVESVQSEGEM